MQAFFTEAPKYFDASTRVIVNFDGVEYNVIMDDLGKLNIDETLMNRLIQAEFKGSKQVKKDWQHIKDVYSGNELSPFQKALGGRK